MLESHDHDNPARMLRTVIAGHAPTLKMAP